MCKPHNLSGILSNSARAEFEREFLREKESIETFESIGAVFLYLGTYPDLVVYRICLKLLRKTKTPGTEF